MSYSLPIFKEKEPLERQIEIYKSAFLKFIQDAPIDSGYKTIFSTLFNVILPLFGVVAIFGGAFAIYSKYFG